MITSARVIIGEQCISDIFAAVENRLLDVLILLEKEFGNLDELAESLGLEKEVEEVHEREQEIPKRFVSMDEVRDFIYSRKKSGLFVGLGVMLCIVSVCGPILAEEIFSIWIRPKRKPQR